MLLPGGDSGRGGMGLGGEEVRVWERGLYGEKGVEAWLLR